MGCHWGFCGRWPMHRRRGVWRGRNRWGVRLRRKSPLQIAALLGKCPIQYLAKSYLSVADRGRIILPMESTSTKRMQLALKVLSWRYNGTAPATDAEIERLKSFLKQDASGMNAMEVAAAVISQE